MCKNTRNVANLVNQDTRDRDQRFNSEPSDSDEDLEPRL